MYYGCTVLKNYIIRAYRFMWLFGVGVKYLRIVHLNAFVPLRNERYKYYFSIEHRVKWSTFIGKTCRT